MFAILNRFGHELAVIVGSEGKAKQRAFRMFQRKHIPIRVVNLTTGGIVAEYCD